MTSAPRTIRVLFQKEWTAAERRGLLAPDPRVRTLGRVLVSYPEVRHIVPDRISLDATAEPRTVETLVRFLERQQWLVKSVVVE
jgi:hypothetical protein